MKVKEEKKKIKNKAWKVVYNKLDKGAKRAFDN